jgi:MFS family permease
MVENSSNIVGPVLAGILLGVVGIRGILLIDLATFLVAILTLVFVFIPQPDRKVIKIDVIQFWQELTFGFRYIFMKPSLFGLQMIFFAANFMTVIGWAVVSPMILARTGSDAQILGFVQSFAAVGGLVGAVFLTLWGGPKRLALGVLLGWVLNGIFGRFLMGISQVYWVWMVSAFLLAFFMPTINGCNQAIWQKKVPPAKQGRVFSARRFIAQITIPVSMGLSGWLGDHVFEPAFVDKQAWGARNFGWLFGFGEGAGLSMMIAISGALVTVVGLVGLLFTQVVNVEEHLPDFDEGGIRQDGAL